DLGRPSLHDAVRRTHWRDEDARDVGTGLGACLLDCVEDGHAFDDLAALARGDAADDLRAGGEHALGMAQALAAGDALDDNARVLIEEDAHGYFSCPALALDAFTAATIFWAPSRMSVAHSSPAPSSRRCASSSALPEMRATSGMPWGSSGCAAMMPLA